MNIALATDSSIPELPGGEDLLRVALAGKGMNVSVVAWNDKRVQWSTYDAVIVRSCWGYYRQMSAFLSWLTKLEKIGVPIYNDAQTIQWNADKKYLLDLKERGVKIAPTVIASKDSTQSLSSYVELLPGDDCVIKPCFGADAYGVYHFNKADLQRAMQQFQQLTNQSDVLVQAFVPEIKDGEISVVFFDNVYSHAVIKKPAPDDFRSNHTWGGQISPYAPSPDELITFSKQYAKCAVDTLYARLDVVRTPHGFVLMELELIEPYLYIEHSVNRAELFADACTKRLKPSQVE